MHNMDIDTPLVHFVRQRVQSVLPTIFEQFQSLEQKLAAPDNPRARGVEYQLNDAKDALTKLPALTVPLNELEATFTQLDKLMATRRIEERYALLNQDAKWRFEKKYSDDLNQLETVKSQLKQREKRTALQENISDLEQQFAQLGQTWLAKKQAHFANKTALIQWLVTGESQADWHWRRFLGEVTLPAEQRDFLSLENFINKTLRAESLRYLLAMPDRQFALVNGTEQTLDPETLLAEMQQLNQAISAEISTAAWLREAMQADWWTLTVEEIQHNFESTPRSHLMTMLLGSTGLIFWIVIDIETGGIAGLIGFTVLAGAKLMAGGEPLAQDNTVGDVPDTEPSLSPGLQ